jgi:YfiH family protein
VASQVHGADVLHVRASSDEEMVRAQRVDALVTGDAGVVIGAVVADCVPVLIGDRRTGACAAIHAGWRGTVAGVVRAAVEAMRAQLGSRAEDLCVAIGPCIGPCCFEVGSEVVTAVLAAFPDARTANAVLEADGRKPHIDLPALNRLTAEQCGVSAAAIEVARLCTRCDAARFYSYRRDRGITGQHVGFISPRDPEISTQRM